MSSVIISERELDTLMLENTQLKQQLEEEKAKVLELKLRLKGSTKELDKTVNDMLHNVNQLLIQQLAKKDTKWQKLKEWLNKEMQEDRIRQKTGDLRFKYCAQTELTILNKMKELESE